MTERQLHGFTADLLRLLAAEHVLWLHIANEGVRSPRTGAFLKRMGMLAGAADFLIVVRGQAHFLELKTAKGRQSLAQLSFQTCARQAGSSYAVCRTPQAVRSTLELWGAIPSASSGSVARRQAA
jgi:hypothetical protein